MKIYGTSIENHAERLTDDLSGQFELGIDIVLRNGHRISISEDYSGMLEVRTLTGVMKIYTVSGNSVLVDGRGELR